MGDAMEVEGDHYQLTVGGETVDFFIEVNDDIRTITMKVGEEEIGDFTIDGLIDETLSMNISIDDAYQGNGLSTLMIYLLCKHLHNESPDTWDTKMLFIDGDGSAGFWKHCGMKINRYGYDWIRSTGSLRIVNGGGMEKGITFIGLFHFATLKSGNIPKDNEYVPDASVGGQGTTEDGVEEEGIDNKPTELRKSSRQEKLRILKLRLARLKRQLAGGYKRAIKKRKQSRKTRKQSRRIRKQSRKKRKHTAKHTRRKRRVKKL